VGITSSTTNRANINRAGTNTKRAGIHASAPPKVDSSASSTLSGITDTTKNKAAVTPFTFTDLGGLHTGQGDPRDAMTNVRKKGEGVGSGAQVNYNVGQQVQLQTKDKARILNPAEVQKRFGAKTTMGTVFSGELEALFGTLKEWNAEARPGYDIFGAEFGLPQNVGEAYIGLQQALDDPANMVTEIQVMDINTAEELDTTVGATVYYGVIGGAYTRLDASQVEHRRLIEKKEILDTYRPFAMSRVQDAIDMKNEITLQGIEDTFTRAREDADKAFKISMEEKKRAHEAAISVAEVKATGVETRATAQVKGQEDRATLNLKYTRESEEAEKAHERDLDIMDATLWNKQETLRASTEASKYLNNLAWELDMASTEQKQAFASNQAHLDRLLQLGQMEQTAELQLQSNLLQAEMIDTTRQQQKMDWIMGLMGNPVALYMMKQSGMMGNIGSLGIGAESAVEKILASVPEESRVNIQGHNAQSDFEQQIASFQAGVTRGMAPEAYQGYVSATAPYVRGEDSRMGVGAPTDYSELIEGPTTGEQITGPDIASDFYQPSALGSLETIMGRGEELMGKTREDITQAFDATEAYRMATGIEEGQSMASWKSLQADDAITGRSAEDEWLDFQADKGVGVDPRLNPAQNAFFAEKGRERDSRDMDLDELKWIFRTYGSQIPALREYTPTDKPYKATN
jgi:hypothetical protein